MKLFENKEKEEEELKDVWVNVKINFDETLRFTDQIETFIKDKIIDDHIDRGTSSPSNEELDRLAKEKIRNIDKTTIKEFFEEFFYDKTTMIKDLISIDYLSEEDLSIEIELDQSEDEEEYYSEDEDEDDEGEYMDEEDENTLNAIMSEEYKEEGSVSSLENITAKIVDHA